MAGATSGARLLEAIYRDPEDDQARRVYGDWLAERGDVRGELIGLQMAATASAGAARRVAALVRQHGKAWLGTLAPVLLAKDLGFRRGFVATATARFRTRAQFEEFAEDPAWATVERLDYSVPTTFPDGQAGWRYGMSAAMTWLQQVDGHAAAVLESTATFPRLRRATLRFGDLARLRALLGSGQLPALESLAIDDHDVQPAWFSSARQAPCRELVLGNHVARFADWVAVARRLGLATLVFEHQVHRDLSTWRFDVATGALGVDNVTIGNGSLAIALAALPDDSITAFTLTGATSAEVVAVGESRIASR